MVTLIWWLPYFEIFKREWLDTTRNYFLYVVAPFEPIAHQGQVHSNNVAKFLVGLNANLGLILDPI